MICQLLTLAEAPQVKIVIKMSSTVWSYDDSESCSPFEVFNIGSLNLGGHLSTKVPRSGKRPQNRLFDPPPPPPPPGNRESRKRAKKGVFGVLTGFSPWGGFWGKMASVEIPRLLRFWGIDHGGGGEGRQIRSKWGGGISRNRSLLRRGKRANSGRQGKSPPTRFLGPPPKSTLAPCGASSVMLFFFSSLLY